MPNGALSDILKLQKAAAQLNAYTPVSFWQPKWMKDAQRKKVGTSMHNTSHYSDHFLSKLIGWVCDRCEAPHPAEVNVSFSLKEFPTFEPAPTSWSQWSTNPKDVKFYRLDMTIPLPDEVRVPSNEDIFVLISEIGYAVCKCTGGVPVPEGSLSKYRQKCSVDFMTDPDARVQEWCMSRRIIDKMLKRQHINTREYREQMRTYGKRYTLLRHPLITQARYKAMLDEACRLPVFDWTEAREKEKQKFENFAKNHSIPLQFSKSFSKPLQNLGNVSYVDSTLSYLKQSAMVNTPGGQVGSLQDLIKHVTP